MADPSDLNRETYKRACILNSNIYEVERNRFLENVLNETKGNTHEFFTIMKSCTNQRKETPESMLYKGEYVKGEEKIKAFAAHLGSSFLQDPPSLGEVFEEINEYLLDTSKFL